MTRISFWIFLIFPAFASAEPLGYIDTTIRPMGKNDRIVVEVFDDPKVAGVSCYVSRAVTGGVTGSLSIAEDPVEMSIACRQTGAISIKGKLNNRSKGESVF